MLSISLASPGINYQGFDTVLIKPLDDIIHLAVPRVWTVLLKGKAQDHDPALLRSLPYLDHLLHRHIRDIRAHRIIHYTPVKYDLAVLHDLYRLSRPEVRYRIRPHLDDKVIYSLNLGQSLRIDPAHDLPYILEPVYPVTRIYTLRTVSDLEILPTLQPTLFLKDRNTDITPSDNP